MEMPAKIAILRGKVQEIQKEGKLVRSLPFYLGVAEKHLYEAQKSMAAVYNYANDEQKKKLDC